MGVTIHSKHNDDEEYIWVSKADGTFTICKNETSTLGRGTKITLHLKEDQLEYLGERKIKDLVKKHSEFTRYPIELLVEKTSEKAQTEQNRAETKGEEIKTNESKEEDEKDDKEVKTEWLLLNKQKPIWMRNPEEVSKEEYAAFYKSFTNDWEDHLALKHFAIEGQLEFKSIIL